MYGHSLITNPSLGMYQEIHPWRAMSIDSVKINTSLIMMREWRVHSVCQIASRGELEMKKILVCDPSLRFSLCLSETFFHCVKAGLFPDLICRKARGFWGAELVGLPHCLPYLKLVTVPRAFSQVVYSWGKYWPWLIPSSCQLFACFSTLRACPI